MREFYLTKSSCLFLTLALLGCGDDPVETTTSTTSTTSSVTSTEGNQVPYAIEVGILPDDPVVTDTINCIAESPLIDPDGDKVTTKYGWLINGASIASTDTYLDAPNFEKGDLVACSITPNDGLEDGPTMQSEQVEVLNIKPSIDEVSISPDPASSQDALYCSWIFTDLDNDLDLTTIEWSVNGEFVSTDKALNAVFAKDDVISCVATPFDGEEYGGSRSDSIVIGNSAPSITSVDITPDPAYSDDSLTCGYSGYSDTDEDADQSTFEWTINGKIAGNSETLTGLFTGGDKIGCAVTPNDGDLTGSVISDTTAISNTEPVLESASLGPDPVHEADTLTCTAGTVTDPDSSDTFTYSTTWTVNGGVIAATDSYLTGSDFDRDDVIFCSMSASDGSAASAPVDSNSVTVSNSLPTVKSVTISPDPAYATDTLLCEWSGFHDADGDAEFTTIEWFVNGVAAGDSTTLSEVFIGGDIVSCLATPNDGIEDGLDVGYELEISNSAPILSAVEISPNPAVTTDALTCTATGYSDADGDDDYTSIAWFINSVEVGTDATLSEGYAGGDEVSCQATPNDGLVDGTMLEAIITIENTLPVLASVTLEPSEDIYELDVLTCIAGETSDEDGTESFTYTTAWFVNEIESLMTTSTLDGTDFNKADTVWCQLTPNDGDDDGQSVVSNSVTILNSLPTVSVVEIDLASPTALDTLTCTWSDYLDADGDEDTSTIDWQVDGSSVGTDGTLAGEFVGGQEVTCIVTPHDGEESGVSASASVSIVNSPPIITSVAISPDPGHIDDTLSCDSTETTDSDGTTEFTYTWTWLVNGVELGGLIATGQTLSDLYFEVGDEVACIMTPHDGTEDGLPVTSNTISIENSPPVISAVTLSPDPAFEGDTLTCEVGDTTDADGTTEFTYLYSWTVDGIDPGVSDSTISSDSFNRDQVVICSVSANDGADDSLPVSSDTLTISNTAPSLSSVTVDVSTAVSGETITCVYDGFSDLDSDEDNSTFSWTVDAIVIGTDSTVNSGFKNGDIVTCTVTPYDGTDMGTPLSATTTILNTAPVINSVTLTPPTPLTTSNVIANVDSSDADGESVTLSYAWFVNGVATGETSQSLAGVTYFDKGDSIYVEVSPSDGVDVGATVTSSTAEVQNSAPSVNFMSIDPLEPIEGIDDLICSVGNATDADTDVLTYTYSWTVDGAAFESPETTFETDDTVSGLDTLSDEIWTCSAVAFDGEDSSPTSSTSVTIAEAPVSCASLGFSGSESSRDRVQIPSFSDLDGIEQATWEAWVNLTDYTANGVIFSTDFATCGIAGDSSYGSDQNKWRCEIDGTEIFSRDPAVTGTWVHVALQTNSGSARLYIDGSMETQTTISTVISSASSASIGYEAGGTGTAFNGLIDEVRFSSVNRYSTPFAPEPIFSLDSWTVGMWHLDEGFGTLAGDDSGNGYDGTIINAVWETASTCDI